MKRKIKTVRLLANFFRDEYYEAYKELIRQLRPVLQNPRWCFQEALLPERPLPLAVPVTKVIFHRLAQKAKTVHNLGGQVVWWHRVGRLLMNLFVYARQCGRLLMCIKIGGG